jgi:hypothetical protein
MGTPRGGMRHQFHQAFLASFSNRLRNLVLHVAELDQQLRAILFAKILERSAEVCSHICRSPANLRFELLHRRGSGMAADRHLSR